MLSNDGVNNVTDIDVPGTLLDFPRHTQHVKSIEQCQESFGSFPKSLGENAIVWHDAKHDPN